MELHALPQTFELTPAAGREGHAHSVCSRLYCTTETHGESLARGTFRRRIRANRCTAFGEQGQHNFLPRAEREQLFAERDLRFGLRLVDHRKLAILHALDHIGPGLAAEFGAAHQAHAVAFGEFDARAIKFLEVEHRLAAPGGSDPCHALTEEHDRSARRPENFRATAGRNDHRAAGIDAHALVVERQRLARERADRTHAHRIGVAQHGDFFRSLRTRRGVSGRQLVEVSTHRRRPALRVGEEAAARCERDAHESSTGKQRARKFRLRVHCVSLAVVFGE